MPAFRIAFPLLLLLSAMRATAHGAPPRDFDPSQAISPGALAVLRLAEPDRRVQEFRVQLESRGLLDGPLAERLRNNPEIARAQFGWMGLAAAVGVDAWQLAELVVGQEVVLSITPRPEIGSPGLVLGVKLRDPQRFDRLLSTLHALAGVMRDGALDPAKVQTIDGVQHVSISPELHHARIGDGWLVSNDRSLLKTAAADKPRNNPEIRWGAGPAKGAFVEAWVDAEALRRRFPALATPDAKAENAFLGLLFADWQHALRHARTIRIWGGAGRDELALHAAVESDTPLPDSHRGLTVERTPQWSWSPEKLPGALGEFTVSHRWADLLAEREALLAPAAVSQVVNFSNTLTTLFGGMDFVNDILPATGAPMRLVMVRQEFAGRETLPVPKLPAFGLVVPLRDAGPRLAQQLFSATQSALAIVNLDAAQKGEATYLIDVDRHAGQRILFTEFQQPAGSMDMGAPRAAAASSPASAATSSSPASGPVEGGVRYNFAPAASVCEGFYLIATSRPLLTDMIDAILAARGAERPMPAADTPPISLRVAGDALAALLRENRRELVINRMLEENRTRAAAEQDVDLFLDLLELVRELRAESLRSDGTQSARLIVDLRPSAPN